jgi:dienelactone hydrolase
MTHCHRRRSGATLQTARQVLSRAACVAGLALTGIAADKPAAPAGSAILVQRASTHPMRFHVSLPASWSNAHDWPVLVVIPDAGRDFVGNLKAFVQARADRPYILVAPEVLSCGGAGSRMADRYTYGPAVWDSLQAGDDFAFEETGLAAVLADVRRLWRGEPRAYLTGWEAGGHTVWALTFRHPERWRGVAPVSPNYQRRGLGAGKFSTAKERSTLPLQVLREGAPTGEMADAIRFLDQQTSLALDDARSHGFRPLPVRLIPAADHGPLPEAVLAWCDSLRKVRRPSGGD